MKTFYVALVRWPNGTHGLPQAADVDDLRSLSAKRIWRVRCSAKTHAVPLVVAFLAGDELADVEVVSR